ncbi:MAG: hypothetical protein DRO52_03790 [Candidatus Hecatellales archaeon]|nr:MAG: hypothetical protein DRO52_03790 [Candidatus Hecatellales archaeon]
MRVKRRPEDERFEELSLLVDAGAAYSWIPGRILQRLGVEPSRRARFKTIEGRVIERSLGHVFVEYQGETAPTTVVFAEEGDKAVFGLEVDPTTGEVRKSEALLALHTEEH